MLPMIFKITFHSLTLFHIFFFRVFHLSFHHFLFTSILFFSLVPSIFHFHLIAIYLFNLFSLDYNLFILNLFQKMQELWILKSGIGVIHHNFKHRTWTIHDARLLSLLRNLGFIERLIHLMLFSPHLGLILHLSRLMLLAHPLFLMHHILLSLHPLHFLHL